MNYRRLGQTGLEVSALGFGCGAVGGLLVRGERKDMVRVVARAIELGITYFDTAPAYGDGASERIFGDALAGVSSPLFLATKIRPTTQDARASVEPSLERLRRDRVDLVQLHGNSYTAAQADEILAPGGLLSQLEALRDEGLIRFIGFTSEDNNPSVYRFIQSGRFDVMQTCYNLLFQHPYEPTRPFGSLIEADAAGMGTVTMRTLTSGLFQKWVRRVNPDDTFDYTAALMQFVLSNPLVDVALVGMRSPQMVDANVAICEDMAGRIDLDWMHEKY